MSRVLSPTVVIAHLAATWFMVGLIWTIHTVHYPLFAQVGDATYVDFQAEHVERIGRLLLLPWSVEGITAAIILVIAINRRDRELLVPAIVGALAMGVVLIISGFWSAPAHSQLADGFDADVHRRLMMADLVRTLAWTIRGAAAIWITSLMWKRRTA